MLKILIYALLLTIPGGIPAADERPIQAGDIAGSTAPAQYDLLIRNGKILDGSGNPWRYGDVGVREGRIAAIGDLSGQTAREVIDASGLIVAPGFIDVHTHADQGLFEQPDAENFIRDGVTTLVTGNCGGSVDDIGEYLDRLEREGMAPNVATLVGHNTVLRQVKGNVGTPLSADQLKQCKWRIRKAMRDGAVGMSTGLIYTPGTYSPTEEIIELQKAAAEYGGLYATHMRSESTKILEAIDEALRIGREAGCRVQISHFKISADNTIGGSNATLKKVIDARSAGQEVWLDQYPYTASSSGLTTLFPDWVLEQGSDKAKEMLSDPQQIPRYLADMKDYHEGKRRRQDFDFAVMTFSRAYPEFTGVSIKRAAQVLKLRGEQGQDAPWRRLTSDQLPPVSMDEQYLAIKDIYLKGGASCVFHTQSEADVENIMRNPLAMVCSDSGIRDFGAGVPHPRGYGSNARVLGLYVREKGVISLEDAVRKMTSLPATSFRFQDRGLIREGFWADLTLFDPERVIDKATYDKPHQYSDGIEYVIVNGQMVLNRGTLTGNRPGHALRGPGYEAKKSSQDSSAG